MSDEMSDTQADQDTQDTQADTSEQADQADQVDQSHLVVARNGALRDPVTGRIIANPPGGPTTAIDPSVAAAYSRRRWQLYRQAAADAVKRANPANTPYAAWGVIVERQAALAADIERGRASTEAARFVGSALGALDRPPEGQARGGTADVTLPGDTLRRLIADLRLLREQLGEDQSE